MTSQPRGFFSPRSRVEDLLRDIRHVSRGLRRTPGFAAAVILTLAVGIGGNTAIFSVVDQVLLRPLPYPRGDEVVTVYEAGMAAPGHFSVSPANWLDWQRQSRTAKAFLSEVDPLTTAISVWMEDEDPHLPIIGVVGDVSEGSLRDEPRPTVFYSHRRLPETGMTLFARSNHSETLAAAAVDALHAIDRTLAVTKVRTIETAMAESLARERLNALVSSSFAVSGLLLAALGVYGLLAFLVTERTNEIGIRIALGAQVGLVTGSVIARGLRLVGVGAAIGAGVSVTLARLFATLLYGVTPYDASTYVAAIALLGSVAVLGSYIPARRAARVGPLVALRQE